MRINPARQCPSWHGRDVLWRELVAANKSLPRVEKKAERQLPLVMLERR
jgi:hypothetical protein